MFIVVTIYKKYIRLEFIYVIKFFTLGTTVGVRDSIYK